MAQKKNIQCRKNNRNGEEKYINMEQKNKKYGTEKIITMVQKK